MADLGASDLTYTISKVKKMEDGRKLVTGTIAFGDGAKYYPTNGVPLTLGKMAIPTAADSINFASGASGYSFRFDSTHTSIRMYQMPIHAHDILLKNSAVSDAAGARVNAGSGNLLGANTGSDVTVQGNKTTGGVQNAVGAALGELVNGTDAPASLTIGFEAIGY